MIEVDCQKSDLLWLILELTECNSCFLLLLPREVALNKLKESSRLYRLCIVCTFEPLTLWKFSRVPVPKNFPFIDLQAACFSPEKQRKLLSKNKCIHSLLSIYIHVDVYFKFFSMPNSVEISNLPQFVNDRYIVRICDILSEGESYTKIDHQWLSTEYLRMHKHNE